jgi:YidC/Oxa1 family membrane protein insertase
MESEKRLIAAIGLSVLILVAFAWLNPAPKRPAPLQTPIEQAEPARPSGGAAPEAGAGAGVEAPPTEPPAGAIAGEAEQQVEIDNGLFRAKFTNRGGRAVEYRLLHFKDDDGQPLEVLPRYTEGLALPLGLDLDDAALSERLDQAVYHIEREVLPADQDNPSGERLRFRWSDGQGLSAEKVFEFRTGSWFVQVSAEVLDRGRRLPARLEIGPGFAAQESSGAHSNYYYAHQSLWNVGGRVTRTKPRKLDAEGGFTGAVLWAGLEDQYFTALVIPNAPQSLVHWRKATLTPIVGDVASQKPEDVPTLSVSIGEEGAALFIGPKQYRLLAEIGSDRQIDKAVWFSSQGWLWAIVEHLFLGLVWLHDNVAHNWGIAIIMATVVLRLVLFPVNQYSMVNMKRTQLQMQKLQPKIKNIRTKYKKAKDAQSRAKMNEELMALYREEGVNPMGGMSGCLPILAQFPILIGFYNMLTVAVELRGAPFVGWIQDLAKEDPFYVLPVLMAVTMFAQQWLAMAKIKDPQQLQQQRMMLFMPLVFGFICLQMPSGLVLYWFVNNLLGMGQQWLVNRHAGRLEAAAQKA